MKQWDFYDKHQERFGAYDGTTDSIVLCGDSDNAELQFKRLIIDAAGPEKMILDLGCGDGIFTNSLSPYFKTVIGIEPSNLLNEVKALVKGENERFPRFFKMDAVKTAFKSGLFDMIISRRGPNPMAEIARLLKIGGVFVFITIGEHDAAGLKKRFGRGQMYGKKAAVLGELENLAAEYGFVVSYGRNFYYQEVFPSIQTLHDFLYRVPIFEDYNERDESSLKAYCRENTNDHGGIALYRHRVVVSFIKGDG